MAGICIGSVLAVSFFLRLLKETGQRLILELFVLLICFFAGAFRLCGEENKQIYQQLVKTGQQIEIQGRIDWIQETEYGWRLMLSHVGIRGEKKDELRLSAFMTEIPAFQPGDMIRAEGILKDFDRAGNPGGFDSYEYYRSLGCHYSFSVNSVTSVKKSWLPVYRCLMELRSRFKSIFQMICTPESSGVFQAMLLGEKQDLSQETKELYSEGGISHILAISGLHIAVIGMGVYRILRRFGGFGLSGLFAGFLIQMYVMMTGSAVSACRAGIMFAIQLFSFICKRSYDMLSAAAAALLLLLWQNPRYLFHSGFQLSFGAVFAIGMLYPRLVRLLQAEKSFFKAFLSSISVSLVTFPILSWNFYEISPYSTALNLIVIPCMTLVMLSGLLGGITGMFQPWAGRFFIALGQDILLFYEWLCKGLHLLPGSRIITGKPSFFIIVLYYAVLLTGVIAWEKGTVWAAGRKKEKRTAGFSICCIRRCILIFFLLLLPGLLCIRLQKGFFVCFLDVSQGDGIYMETQEGMRILVDGGSSDKKSLYEQSILPFLKSRGVRKIDYAVVTHPDEDHISALRELIREGEIRVKLLLLPAISREMQDEAYLELLALADETDTVVGFLSAGDRLQMGRLAVTCLYPYKGLETTDRNGYSTVLEVCYGEFSMLLTGDLDEKGESFLVKQLKGKEKVYDVLKIAHHGSRFSTGEEFLSKVRPEYAVISCGRRNSYGHPHQEVLQRLAEAEVKVFITPETGAVIWESDGKESRIIDIR